MSRQVKDASILKIDGKELLFKRSDIKLFLNLKSSINEVEQVLRESGKIPDSERKRFIADMIEGYLSVMLVLHYILTSFDAKRHSVRRVTNASYVIGQNLIAIFVTSGAAARTQPRLTWKAMSVYNELILHHSRMMKRLSGATISSLRKAVSDLEERNKDVANFDDYLVDIAIPALQVKESAHVLLEESDILMLKEYQISQLHHMLKRTKVLLEWKHPRLQD